MKSVYVEIGAGMPRVDPDYEATDYRVGCGRLVGAIDDPLYDEIMFSGASAVIQEARRRSGLSQAELARRAHVSQPVISAYESGRREPGLSMLTKLVEASGHTLSLDLVADPDTPPGLPDTPTGRKLRLRRRAIIEAAERRGATNVRVFGSVARGTDTESSDVDLLVDLSPNVGIVGLIGLEREIAEILGREVDVVPAANLKSGLAVKALAEAIPL